MLDNVVTLVGNLVADPELKYIPSGAAVANFTVAQTPRNLNKQTNQWEDGEPTFIRCSIWREAAENVVESLSKGARVIVLGRLKSRPYEKDGQKRTSVELEVEDMGASLKYATAKPVKTGKGGGSTQSAPSPASNAWDSNEPPF